jgi:hypothetical protein
MFARCWRGERQPSELAARPRQPRQYRCPTGHALRSDRRKFSNPRTRVTKADAIIYRASQLDCKNFSIAAVRISDIDSPASRNVFYVEERAIDLCSTAAVG